MVDLVGLEPTTSSMPWKRAPNCATGPRADNCLSILAQALVLVKRGTEQRRVAGSELVCRAADASSVVPRAFILRGGNACRQRGNLG